MRRWNGWGDTSKSMDLPNSALPQLNRWVGNGSPLTDVTWDEMIESVPQSRLSEHDLYTCEASDRLMHARGQSLPDWLAMRGGDIGIFPDAVAYPECTEDVQALMDLSKAQDYVLIPYGGGTSVVGHINPVASSRPIITVDMGRMNRLIELDPESQIATIGPGASGPVVESQLRAKGYTLGHFPQSFELSTVGGWVASRSSGQQSLRYGRIEQMFAGGRVITPKGTLEIPTFPASSAGPDLREWVLGSEGRMGIISEVKMRVTRLPDHEDFYVFFFPSWEKAKQATRELVQQKAPLSMLRLSNAIETETQLALAGHPQHISWLERYLDLRGARQGKCMMTFGVTGTKQQCSSARHQAQAICKGFSGIGTGTFLGKKWSQKRFMMPYLREALWEKGYVVDTLETATDWDNVDDLLDRVETELSAGLNHLDEKVHVFTHLSHIYAQGSSIYTTYVFRAAKTNPETLLRWQTLKSAASRVISENKGTISHQHGVGKDHAPYLAREKGELGMEALKHTLDFFDEGQHLNPETLIASDYPEGL